jgi:imidazolonepropionase-like amidohydrolase
VFLFGIVFFRFAFEVAILGQKLPPSHGSLEQLQMLLRSAMHVFLLSALALLAACSQSDVATPSNQHLLVIQDVGLIDVRVGRVTPGQTIVVDRNRIVEVGPNRGSNIPSHSRVIDGSGKYLIPGLWDMHAHTSSDAISRKIVFPLFIAHGVTGIRNMMSDCLEESAWSCWSLSISIEETKVWRHDIAAGTLVGPRIVAGSAAVHGPEPGEPSTIFDPATAEHGRAHVRLLAERGVDFIKIYDELPRDAYFAIADEAGNLGIPIAGHVPVAVQMTEASDAGQKSIEHCCAGSLYEQCSSREAELRKKIVLEVNKEDPRALPILLEMIDSYDEKKCESAIETLVRNDTWYVPTLMVAKWSGDWSDDPRVRFLPPAELRYWAEDHDFDERLFGTSEERLPVIRQNNRLLRKMKEAGVRMLAGADPGTAGVFFGSSLPEELELLVQAGFDEAEALRTATINPAEFLGRANELGSIEPGKLADLVLLDANPLDDIGNVRKIRTVIANGQVFDRSDLDLLLVEAEQAAQGMN